MTIGILKATDLMNTVWATVAPFAYARYLARGRGGVLIPVGGISLSKDGEGRVDASARFVTSEDVANGTVILPAEVSKEFAEYDPEREVVFLFDEGEAIATYRGAPSGQPTPKELYVQASQSLKT